MGEKVFLKQFHNEGKMDGLWTAGELRRIISSLMIVTSIVTDNACDRLDRNPCGCHTLNIVVSKWVKLERLPEKYRRLAQAISIIDSSWASQPHTTKELVEVMGSTF